MLLQSLKSYIHRTAIGYTEGHNHVMSLICDADADEENERRGSEFQEEVIVSVDRTSTQRCTTLADAVLEGMKRLEITMKTPEGTSASELIAAVPPDGNPDDITKYAADLAEKLSG